MKKRRKDGENILFRRLYKIKLMELDDHDDGSTRGPEKFENLDREVLELESSAGCRGAQSWGFLNFN